MRPFLLMDVDGPLNPFEASWFQSEPAPGFGIHELTPEGGVTYRVALNPAHGEQLRALSSVYDLAWATTWLDDANRLIAPILGLPSDLPVVPLARPQRHTARRSWKAEEIVRWVDERPFFWFDDEINRATREWLATHQRAGDHVAHRVDARSGLSPDDFATMRSFAASV